MSQEAAQDLTAGELAQAVLDAAKESSVDAGSEVSVQVETVASVQVSMPNASFVERAAAEICEGKPGCTAVPIAVGRHRGVASSRRNRGLAEGYAVEFTVTITPSEMLPRVSAVEQSIRASLGSDFVVTGNATVATSATVVVVTVGTEQDAAALLENNLTASSITTAVAQDLAIDAANLQVSEPKAVFPPRSPPARPPPPPPVPSEPPAARDAATGAAAKASAVDAAKRHAAATHSASCCYAAPAAVVAARACRGGGQHGGDRDRGGRWHGRDRRDGAGAAAAIQRNQSEAAVVRVVVVGPRKDVVA